MEKSTITQKDVLNAVAKDMMEANMSLIESAPDRFNRYVLNLIQHEIKTGRAIALRERRFNSDSREYVHRNNFPLAVYEGMDQDFLKALESLDVYIYRNKNINTAGIRIIFHF